MDLFLPHVLCIQYEGSNTPIAHPMKTGGASIIILLIKQAKGKKDRITPISEKIIELLRQYYKAYKPQTWLFEGQTKGEQYSGKSLENVLKQALQKANIKKPVSLH